MVRKSRKDKIIMDNFFVVKMGSYKAVEDKLDSGSV